jgi:thiol:disulfide interchange protein
MTRATPRKTLALPMMIGLLQCMTLIAKVSGRVNATWAWVLAPTWVPAVFAVCLVLSVLSMLGVLEFVAQLEIRRRARRGTACIDPEVCCLHHPRPQGGGNR